MAIAKELLDQLLAGRDPRDLFARDGLVDELKKALSERILNSELDAHLDDERAAGSDNHRNGISRKTMLTGMSKVTLDIPRDRAGTFDPRLIAKYQRRFPDFDDKIVSMYARGMTVREIRGHLKELYGIDVSPELISTVTDAVLEEVAEWQNRPLDVCYPLVFFDAIRVKIRDEGFVRNKAVYSDGQFDLGLIGSVSALATNIIKPAVVNGQVVDGQLGGANCSRSKFGQYYWYSRCLGGRTKTQYKFCKSGS
jgi:putative transposase